MLLLLLWGRICSKPASILSALGLKNPHSFVLCKQHEQFLRLAPTLKKDALHLCLISLNWRQELYWLNSMTFVMKKFRYNCISLFCNHLVLVEESCSLCMTGNFNWAKWDRSSKSSNLKSCWTNKFSLTFAQNLFKHKFVKESQQFRFNISFKEVIHQQHFHNKLLVISFYWF